jgi:hypothetical protein
VLRWVDPNDLALGSVFAASACPSNERQGIAGSEKNLMSMPVGVVFVWHMRMRMPHRPNAKLGLRFLPKH